MGMRDESWCSSCGCSQPYSEEEVICGTCTSEAYEMRSNQLVNYMKLHLISLEQDSEKIWNAMDQIDDLESDEYEMLNIEDIRTNGQIAASRHLLSVASDILGIQIEEK
jgi:glycerol kinase